MADLLASGRLVDLILLFVALEALALALYFRATGRGVAIADLLPNLLAGALLLLTLRFSLSGAGWITCCGTLAAAGLAHLWDLARRWRRAPSVVSTSGNQ
jgi:hypothetical protein